MANKLMGKFKSILKQPEEENNNYDDYYDDEESSEEDEQTEEEYEFSDEQEQEESSDNVINMNEGVNVQFVLFKPEAFDPSVKDMADELIKRNTVILNVEDTNKDVSKRIIDFLGGVAYAQNGSVKKVAEDTFIIMPSNVILSGQDAMDEVGSDNVYF